MTLNDSNTPQPGKITACKVVLRFAVVIVIQVAGSLAGGNMLWGTSVWSLFPLWAVGLVTSLYLLVSVPAVGMLLSDTLLRLLKPFAFSRIKLGAWAGWTLLVILLGVGVWLLRSQNLIYGDGFSVVERMSRPLSSAFDSIHEFVRPLTVLLHVVCNAVLIDALHWNARDAFSIISVVGGVFGMLGLAAVVRFLASDLADRATIFMIALSGGGALIFLGHIELYVWPSAVLMWGLAATFRYLQTGRGVSIVILLALVLALFDAMLLPVAVTIVSYSLFQKRDDRVSRVLRRPLVAVLTLVALSVIGATACYFGGFTAVVPIIPLPDDPYAVFSLYHVVDWLNLLFFLAPVGVVLLIAALLSRSSIAALSGEVKLLAVVTAACFLVGFWIDPILGAIRDWDLLSFFSWPLSLLGGSLLVSVVSDARLRRIATVQAFITMLFILAPLAYDNTDASASLARLEPVVWNDIHFQPEYTKANRCSAWGYTLFKLCGRTDLAEKYFRRVVQANPRSDFAWQNLGAIAFAQHRYASAEDCFARAYVLNPRSDEYRESLASAMSANGNYLGAARLKELSDQSKKH